MIYANAILFFMKTLNFQNINLYYGEPADVNDILHRKVLIQPILSDKMKLKFKKHKPKVLLKFDILGLDTNKAYDINDILENKEQISCKI